MEENTSKSLWVWIVVVLVVVAGLVIWGMNASAPAPITQDNTPVDSTEDTSEGSINSGASAATIAYADALIKYKDARLQLDKNCQASPDKMTFKNNAYLMVDNRAPVARTVKVGTSFPIKAYGFKIVKLSSNKLPATWLVDCGTSQNVSTVTIQK